MIYKLIITESAEADILKLRKSGDKKALKKLDTLLDELREHPKTGTGKPEQLKYQLSGKWSREITTKHRIVYEIYDETIIVEVIQAYGHYLDK
jgi:toxin YoeB